MFLVSWVVLMLVTIGRVWICLFAVLDLTVIDMFLFRFYLITVLFLNVL